MHLVLFKNAFWIRFIRNVFVIGTQNSLREIVQLVGRFQRTPRTAI